MRRRLTVSDQAEVRKEGIYTCLRVRRLVWSEKRIIDFPEVIEYHFRRLRVSSQLHAMRLRERIGRDSQCFVFDECGRGFWSEVSQHGMRHLVSNDERHLDVRQRGRYEHSFG